MSEKIEPALSAEEWKRGHAIDRDRNGLMLLRAEHIPDAVGVVSGNAFSGLASNLAGMIALANAALPESDPRKITREKIAWLSSAVDAMYGESTGEATDQKCALLNVFLDALESYLPPEA